MLISKVMNYQIIIAALFCVCFSMDAANAQRKQYVRIKAKPLVRFDWECTKPSLYPKSKLDRLVRPLLRGYTDIPGLWGDRAFIYDLNDDNAEEYFIPLNCGATGNCRWGIFSLKPARLLGVIFAENIYVHQRQGRWSQLTTSGHLSSSDSMIDTYLFEKGHYRKFGKSYEASGFRDDFPQLLLTVEPLCNPSYLKGSIQR
jgi:hypothetical protein